MYGLEKKKVPAFEFDLEKELKGDVNKVRSLLATTEEKTKQIKEQLRLGARGPDLDNLGILFHGYTALKKVLNKFL